MAASAASPSTAEDDEHAIAMARDVMASLDWADAGVPAAQPARPPRLDADELLGVMTLDIKRPVDMVEVIGRTVDDSAGCPSSRTTVRPLYAAMRVSRAMRWASSPTTGRSTRPAPPRPPSSSGLQPVRHPIVFLQNTTGFIVGRASEEAGMINTARR